jgi:hypothetical protein
LYPPSPLVAKYLASLLVRCTKGCGQVVEFQHLRTHLESNCTSTPIPAPSFVSVQQLLDNLSETSLMQVQTTGLLLDKLLPASGSITCKTPKGKVSTSCTKNAVLQTSKKT